MNKNLFSIFLFLFVIILFFNFTCSNTGLTEEEIKKKIKTIVKSGLVNFDSDTYTGLSSSAAIILNGENLTEEYQLVGITSDSDSSGITVILDRTGDYYLGIIGFTSGSSGSGNIEISHGDTVNVTFSFINSLDSTIDTAMFYNSIGDLTFDNTEYEGFESFAIVTLTDFDLSGTSYDVTVDASTDSIKMTLTGSNGIYTGTLGFIPSGSEANKIVVDSSSYQDDFTITYIDNNPSDSTTDVADWVLYKRYIIFSESYDDYNYPGLLSRSPDGSDPNYIGAWGSATGSVGSTDAYEGTQCFNMSWSGGLVNGTVGFARDFGTYGYKDLNEFSGGNIVFQIKALSIYSDDPYLIMKSQGQVDTSVSMTPYMQGGVLTSEYQEITIPLSKFTVNPDAGPTLQLDEVYMYFLIGHAPAYATNYRLDHIRLEKDPR